ncbi:MAG: hypothetical protein C3F13_07680 [Anaerolineales bacterium]|nr:hypothetical protein [Anaerolineae bacterium]PWB53777.1 MAG: hypothetical protein C3F13_07680 [Anaerolineales bacterium]
MSSDEFSPQAYFLRVLQYWWVVLIATLLGGAFGYLFFHLHPPVYEATAEYFVTLDLNSFPHLGMREDLIQYNEDMALNTTEGALLATQTINQVVSQAKDAGYLFTVRDLLKNYTIERKHDIWELRFRNPNPAVAQAIANIWALAGYQEMLKWQATGLAPGYVIFQAPTPASLPEQPILYGRNNLMLAGVLIGFIIGIFISVWVSRVPKTATRMAAE